MNKSAALTVHISPMLAPSVCVSIFVPPHTNVAALGDLVVMAADGAFGPWPIAWIFESGAESLRTRTLQAHERGAGFSIRDAPDLESVVRSAIGGWLMLLDASENDAADAAAILTSVAKRVSTQQASIVVARSPASGRCSSESPRDAGFVPPPVSALLLRCDEIDAAVLADCRGLPTSMSARLLLWHQLVRAPDAKVLWVGGPAHDGFEAEPPTTHWRNPITYVDVVAKVFVETLSHAAAGGDAPVWLQSIVAQHLAWYFTVDGRARAPTVIVDESTADEFHRLVTQAMAYVRPVAIAALPAASASAEVKHVLLSYRGVQGCTAAVVDAYDHDQCLARISYYIHGAVPVERLIVDGHSIEPLFAKCRGIRYFHRLRLRQRIVWIPVKKGVQLRIELNERSWPIDCREPDFEPVPTAHEATPLSLETVRRSFMPGKRGQQPLPKSWVGWKARLLRLVAALPWIRQRYRDAWVLIDREESADDNAEHFYRWLQQNHPEINAWFLLMPDSSDWARLAKDGFNLMPPGLNRKLLILNAKQVISSHTDYVFGGMDRRLYGDAMQWRATFLQHGVIKDDLTHWLGPREFDCFVTSSPAEHASIVGDDTAYPYTDREVRRTGMPRHDRLVRFSRRIDVQEIRSLLVMPTWRASLVDERAGAGGPGARQAAFAGSAYATQWRRLLRHERLHEMLKRHGHKLVFMPHPNSAPYIDAFDPPAAVEVVTAQNSVVQEVFVRTAAFITDYTSVAFTMALLRRPVFYYQFDRKDFYGGGHNWRPGYFDYERDGFGPVALDEEALIGHLEDYFSRSGRPHPVFLKRMEIAMPDLDECACQRVYDSILDMGKLARGVEITRV